MTLSFSTHWPNRIGGNETFFIPKIWQSLIQSGKSGGVAHLHYYNEYFNKFGAYWDEGWDFRDRPKKHTIREDVTNRWKDGNDVHFAINNRNPNYFRFAPIVKCISVQKIEIGNPFPTNPNYVGNVWVDGKKLDSIGMRELAINDGFDSIEQFFLWFNTDFTGNIIHWTDLKY